MLPANAKRELDLSLYLVTGRDLLPHDKVPLPFSSLLLTDSIFIELFDFSRGGWSFTLSLNILPWDIQALQGGVTVVQVREKNLDTAEVRRLSR
jgi:thiamine monophosphate synthase